MRTEAELRQAIATLESVLPVMTPDNARSMAATIHALRWAAGAETKLIDLLDAVAEIRRKAQERN